MASKTRDPKHPLILALDGVMAKTRQSNGDVGKTIGFTEAGVRWCRKYGWPPKNPLVRRALVRFIAKHDPGAGRRKDQVDA